MRSKRRLAHTAFVELDTRACQACWRCVEACRKGVVGKVSVLWHKHAKLREGSTCVGCLGCVAVCQAGAMQRRRVPE